MPRALLTEIPRRWTEEGVIAVQRAAVERLAGGAGDRALPAFIVLHAVRSAIEAYRLLAPDGVAHDHLHDELVALATRYLAAPPSGGASATTKA